MAAARGFVVLQNGLRAHILMATGFFPGVKRPGREVDHSCLFSAEVKNERGYTSTACFYVMC